MRVTEIPVLVVGGGAAGTMLSLELARHGVSARTVDRLSGPATTSKAITIHARMAEIFAQIDQRLIDRYVARGIHNKGYVLHFVDAEGARSEVRPGIDFTAIDSRYPYILVHSQSETEQGLRDYLLDEFGRATEWGTECTGVEHSDDGVLATLRDSRGELERVSCQYLVACDGMNSRVRRSLGLIQDESDYAGTKMQNLDVFLDNFPDVDDYVHYCVGTDHFIMIVKLPGGYYRLLLSDRGEAADPSIQPERAFMNLVDKHFSGVSLGDVVWHSKWESFVRLAHTYRDRNVFLAGDSAHVHSTTGGQGMNCCMQDAWNLGWKLGLVLNGAAGVGLLDSYGRERRPIAEQVIWAASSLHDIFMGHGQDISERVRKIDDPAFLKQVVGRCSGISYTYRDSVTQRPSAAGDSAPAGPANGDRAADVRFGNGQWLSELSRHGSFSLFVVGDGDPAESSVAGELDTLARHHGDLLQVFVLPGSAGFAEHYGSGEQAVLVRPDGYIGWRCPTSRVGEIAEYFAGILG